MFSKTHLQILLVIALKTLVIVSADAEEDQTSLPQAEVDLVLDGIESKIVLADNISLEDLDFAKNGSDYHIDSNNNSTNNIRRWAPYPQDLTEVSTEKSLPATSSLPWSSNPAGQPPTYQSKQISSTTIANPWITGFWNSLPNVTGTIINNQHSKKMKIFLPEMKLTG